MPLSSFITSVILGIMDSKFKWMFPVVFGALSILIPALIFGYFPLSLDHLFQGSFYSFIPSFIGLGIGGLIKRFKI
jgi:hypothetical protein